MREIALFGESGAALPAHIQEFLDDTGANIVERPRVPTLSYAGKVWTISLPDGTSTPVTKVSDDGDVEPVQTLRVVVLDFAKKRGRTYYEGAFDPEKVGAPQCWSEDGVTPDKSVESPQHSKCDGCPMSIKGSKITDAGKAVRACSEHRNLVVLPVHKDVPAQPLRLKLAITSLFDKQSPELEAAGWRAFENYTDYLRGNGVMHTAVVVTKMKFDQNANYPKVIFSPDRWLSKSETVTIQKLVASDEVVSMLGFSTPVEEPVAAIQAPKVEKKPATKTKPAETKSETKPTPVVEDDDDVDDEVVINIIPTKKSAAVDTTVLVTEDDDVDEPPAKAKKPAKGATDVPDDVQALLDEWDD